LEYSLGRHGAIGISSLAIVAFVLQAVAQLQASSRFVFAIARDQALPFSDFFKQTNRARMPVHATWLVSSLTVPLAFALWQMPVLYSTFLSLGGGALCLLSYVSTAGGWDLTMTYQLRSNVQVVPICLYLLSQVNLQTEGRTSWSLRGMR
jgi:amino acid transporter